MKTVFGFKIYETEQVVDFLQACLINLGVLALYIVVAGIVLRLAGMITDKLFSKLISASRDTEHKKHIATIKNLVKSLINGLIVVIFVLSFLGRYNIDIRPLLTAAGVVGVAVGFAARRFVEDIIMGIFILLEGQVRVGDYVTIDTFSGTVEKVTLKMIIIRNVSGHVHYIRNGMIGIITNHTTEFASPIIDMGVAYNSNIDHVISVMKSVAQKMREDEKYSRYILEDMDILGVNEFQDSAIVVRGKIKTVSSQQWYIVREYNKLIKEAFDREGIEIPFPQRDVHLIKSE